MAKAIIHVGMHKTGSSSIQASLASLPQGRGPTIVQVGSANLSGLLKKGFNSNMTAERVRAFTSETFDQKRAATKARLRKAIEAHSHEDIVISGEGFTGLTAADFEEFMSMLPYSDIEVVGYVRPPHSMMSSAFQQRLKSGLTRLNPNALIPAYKRLFEKFEQAPSMRLRVFDRSTLLNGCVVQDFCDISGIEIKPEEVINKNEALSLEASRLLFCFNRWREKVGLISQRGYILTETLGVLEGEKLTLSSEIIDPVIARHDDSISWVEERVGASLRSAVRVEGITSEAEMLSVSETTTRWLARQVKGDWKVDPSEEQIGIWMQLLYERVPLVNARKDRRGSLNMDDAAEDGE